MTRNVNVVGNPAVSGVRVSQGPAEGQEPGDDRIAIPLEGEEALRALLHVDPHAEPVEEGQEE